MPPRHVYWTIILEGKPTAFRAHTREELLPTFKQLQSKHADIQMKWFARGRLWESPDEERASKRNPEERRGPSWRPGGAHEDPRERFRVPRDVKRQRVAAKLRRDHSRGGSDGPARGGAGDAGPSRPAPGTRPTGPRGMPNQPTGSRGPANRPTGPRAASGRPPGPRQRGPQSPRPFRKPGPGGGKRGGGGGRGGGRTR
jgi:hypothetical protein